MTNETGELWKINDAGSFTAIADGAITAGALVKCTSSDDVVTSTGDTTYAYGDIKVSLCDASNDNVMVVGIAQQAAADGEPVTVLTEGIFILQGDSVTAGYAIMASASAEKPYTVVDVSDGYEELKIGKALSGGSTTDKYILALIRI